MKYLNGMGPFYAEDVGKEMAGKTLIGTCGDCQYWQIDNAMAGRQWGDCTDFPFLVNGKLGTKKDFGCNHFKEKP